MDNVNVKWLSLRQKDIHTELRKYFTKYRKYNNRNNLNGLLRIDILIEFRKLKRIRTLFSRSAYSIFYFHPSTLQ